MPDYALLFSVVVFDQPDAETAKKFGQKLVEKLNSKPIELGATFDDAVELSDEPETAPGT